MTALMYAVPKNEAEDIHTILYKASNPKNEAKEIHTILNPELKDIILQVNKTGGTDIKVNISDHIFTIKSIEGLLYDEDEAKELFSEIIKEFNNAKGDALFIHDVFKEIIGPED